MSTPSTSDDTYPGHGYTLSQLLNAVKRQLRHAAFGRRIAATTDQLEVDSLERDALEILCLIRSMRNSFAPINRIPPEVLSLIPDYYGGNDEDDDEVDKDGDGEDDGGDEHVEEHTDEDLIALTHVCRGWRDTFTSRSSLWTRLDFKNVDKTRTYIQRSQYSPLEFFLEHDMVVDDAFAQAIPHIHRLKSLVIGRGVPLGILGHFCCHTPLLEELHINTPPVHDLVIDGALFNGDHSSLRVLSLHGRIKDFPWNNLANLQAVELRCYFKRYGTTQLLDFFESAPLLHTVALAYSMPDSSDAPPGRMVPLRHLKTFTIRADPPHSILLHHLHVPAGVSLTSELRLDGEPSPLLYDVLWGSPNLSNLSHITTIRLLFTPGPKYVRLNGPSGSLRVVSDWWWDRPSYAVNNQILLSIGYPILSSTRKLTISGYQGPTSAEVEDCPIFRTLSAANNIRTLILVNCNNEAFTRALDPERNPSNLVVSPNIGKLILCISFTSPEDKHYQQNIISMAENRASRGAKLPSITIAGLGTLVPPEMALKIRKHVERVDYYVMHTPPPWDCVVNDSGGESE